LTGDEADDGGHLTLSEKGRRVIQSPERSRNLLFHRSL